MHHQNSSWLRPAYAASGVLILISLIAFKVLGNVAARDWAVDPASWFSQLYGFAAFLCWTYLWLALRQLLHRCAARPQTDLLIYLLIGVNTISFLTFFLIPVSALGWLITPLWVGSSFMLLIFAFWLRSFPHELFGYKELFAGTLMAIEVAQLVIYLGLFRLFPDFASAHYQWVDILMGILRVVNLAMLYQLFDQASKQPIRLQADANDSLIDEIGGKED